MVILTHTSIPTLPDSWGVIKWEDPLEGIPYAVGAFPWRSQLSHPLIQQDCSVKDPHNRMLTNQSSTRVLAFWRHWQTNHLLRVEEVSPFHMTVLPFDNFDTTVSYWITKMSYLHMWLNRVYTVSAPNMRILSIFLRLSSLGNLTPAMLMCLWHFSTCFPSPQNPKTVCKTSGMGLYLLTN